MRLLAAAGLLFALLSGATLAAPLSEAERDAQIAALTWIEGPGSYALPDSKSHLALSQGDSLLIGADAARYDELLNGVAAPQTEAILLPASGDRVIYFEYFNVGHIDDDDWSDVDADSFLKQMKADDAEANRARKRNGVEPFYTGGWREAPRFDAVEKTAYWAMELYNDRQETWLNAVAIRLNRGGYARIVWVGDQSSFPNAATALAPVIAAQSFDAGARYADFTSGDRLAGVGVGALTATLLGVKVSKGLFAVVLAFLAVAGKKILAVLAVAGGLVFWRRRKARDGRAPGA